MCALLLTSNSPPPNSELLDAEVASPPTIVANIVRLSYVFFVLAVHGSAPIMMELQLLICLLDYAVLAHLTIVYR